MGLFDAIGNVVSAGMNLYGANKQNAASAHQAAMAQDFTAEQTLWQHNWEENMSNTAYQRATKDMQAAGLNPMLAYSQGGAGTPNVGAGTGVAAPMVNTMSGAAASAGSVIRDVADIAKTRSEAKLNESQASVNDAMVPRLAAETIQAQSSAARTKYGLEQLDPLEKATRGYGIGKASLESVKSQQELNARMGIHKDEDATAPGQVLARRQLAADVADAVLRDVKARNETAVESTPYLGKGLAAVRGGLGGLINSAGRIFRMGH